MELIPDVKKSNLNIKTQTKMQSPRRE